MFNLRQDVMDFRSILMVWRSNRSNVMTISVSFYPQSFQVTKYMKIYDKKASFPLKYWVKTIASEVHLLNSNCELFNI